MDGEHLSWMSTLYHRGRNFFSTEKADFPSHITNICSQDTFGLCMKNVILSTSHQMQDFFPSPDLKLLGHVKLLLWLIKAGWIRCMCWDTAINHLLTGHELNLSKWKPAVWILTFNLKQLKRFAPFISHWIHYFEHDGNVQPFFSTTQKCFLNWFL